MDLPGAKSYARDKWHTSRKRGGHRPHEPRQAGQQQAPAERVVHEQLSDTGSDVSGEGVELTIPSAISSGLDLERLLEETRLQFEGAFHRYSSVQDDLLEQQPPPVIGNVRGDQELVLDMTQLGRALTTVSHAQLLGLPNTYVLDLTTTDVQALSLQTGTTQLPCTPPLASQVKTTTVQPTRLATLTASTVHTPQAVQPAQQVPLQPAIPAARLVAVSAAATAGKASVPTVKPQPVKSSSTSTKVTDDFLDDLLGSSSSATLARPVLGAAPALGKPTKPVQVQPTPTQRPPVQQHPAAKPSGHSLEDWLGI